MRHSSLGSDKSLTKPKILLHSNDLNFVNLLFIFTEFTEEIISPIIRLLCRFCDTAPFNVEFRLLLYFFFSLTSNCTSYLSKKLKFSFFTVPGIFTLVPQLRIFFGAQYSTMIDRDFFQLFFFYSSEPIFTCLSV